MYNLDLLNARLYNNLLNTITEHKSFRKGVAGFSIATGISRITGLLREMVMAQLFGAGFAKDAFEVAFRIPNLLRDFFAENALSASFVPVFVDKMQHSDKRELWRFANNLFNTLLVIVGVVVALGVVFSPQIVSVIGHGFKAVPGKLELTTLLNRVLFPFLLFISLSAWCAGVLNSHNSFFLPALSSSFFNVLSIAGAYLTYSYWISKGLDPVLGMALGGMAGAFLQFLVPYIAVWTKGYRFSPYMNWRSADLARVLKLWGPVIIGLSLVEVQVAVDTFLAALLEQGSVSWLSYAYRIMHLPLGIFGTAVGTVSLPLYSKLFSSGDTYLMASSLKRSLRMVSLLLIPISVFIAGFAEPIVRVIYQRGNFSAIDTSCTAQAVVFYILGIWAASSAKNLSGAFYAMRNSKTPMFVNLASVGLNVCLNLLIAFVILKERQFRGFAIATSISYFFSMTLMMIILKRKLAVWNASDHILFGLRTLVASVLSGLPIYLCYRFALLPQLAGKLGQSSPWLAGFWGTLLVVALGFVLFILLYFLIGSLFGIKEFRDIVKRSQ